MKKPSPHSRERRPRYSGITQDPAPRAELSDAAAEVARKEPSKAPEIFWETALEATEHLSAPPATLPSREVILETAEAMMRARRGAGVQLSAHAEPRPYAVPAKVRWRLGSSVAVLVALLGGVFLGGRFAAKSSLGPRSGSVGPVASEPRPDPDLERETGEAFALCKAKKYPEAAARFADLARRFPQTAAFAVEHARCLFYSGNFLGAQQVASANLQEGRAIVDSHFILGLVQLANKSFDSAVTSFRNAAALDISRADIQFMWAEAHRRAGHIHEAVLRYQAAYERNQYETNEVTYQLKWWLAQIADDSLPGATLAQIRSSAASGAPTYQALVADAALVLRSGDRAQAARRLGEAQRLMDPLLFEVALRDPEFAQEAWRPELSSFYSRQR